MSMRCYLVCLSLARLGWRGYLLMAAMPSLYILTMSLLELLTYSHFLQTDSKMVPTSSAVFFTVSLDKSSPTESTCRQCSIYSRINWLRLFCFRKEAFISWKHPKLARSNACNLLNSPDFKFVIFPKSNGLLNLHNSASSSNCTTDSER